MRQIYFDVLIHVLAKILKMLPENRPGNAQIVTHVNGPVMDGLFVLDIERHSDRCDQRAILEIRQEIGVEAHHK